MDKLELLKQAVEGLQPDYDKFYQKGNKTAGTRLRKGLAEIKRLCSEMRQDVQSAKKVNA